MPDTTISDFVVVSLNLNRGFLLIFQQEEKADASNNSNDRFFLTTLRFKKAKNDLWRMFHFRLPVYEPIIRIYLPKDELVTLFRALPSSTRISIRLR
jgi:hypothetical protein